MIASDRHATLTWGPAQLGVAAGVLDAFAHGVLDDAVADSHLLIVAVWVSPDAVDADAVYHYNREATTSSLARGRHHDVSVEDLVALRDQAINGYYVPPTLR
jgi:5,6,7,8-tetrahydromethanopterin hydro-lyase